MLVWCGLNLKDEVKIALAKEFLRLFQNVVYIFLSKSNFARLDQLYRKI
jgi:hypothetical protein